MRSESRPVKRVLSWGLVWLLPILAAWFALRGAVSRRAMLDAVRQQRVEAVSALEQLNKEIAEVTAAKPPSTAGISTGVASAGVSSMSGATGSGDRGEADRWRRPPATLPSWQPESPYLWMRKESFAKLPLTAMSREGELEGSVADALSIPQPLRERIRTRIGETLENQRDMEVENAVVRTTPGKRETDEPGMIEVEILNMQEINHGLRAEVEKMFREELGEARGTLLAKVASGWMEEQFGDGNGNSKLYALSRAEGGGFDVRKIDGGGMLSACCPRRPEELEAFIPAHLRALFEPITSMPSK